jgi:4a-hydroxytetrahydrobiopterin dehydratase
MTDPITVRDFNAADGTQQWRVVGDGAHCFFPTESFEASARLVQAISELPDVDDHPPHVDVRPDGVNVRLITNADGYFGLTRRDVDLAGQISAAATDLGLAADPSAVQSVLVIPGALDISAVMPFWQAALAYVPRGDNPDEDLVDPHDRGPALWFEEMNELRADGGGSIHVAVWVPPELGEARVAAALAAGGHIVRDSRAPSWWTLADAAGNELDISTAVNRD